MIHTNPTRVAGRQFVQRVLIAVVEYVNMVHAQTVNVVGYPFIDVQVLALCDCTDNDLHVTRRTYILDMFNVFFFPNGRTLMEPIFKESDIVFLSPPLPKDQE